jgi:Flp pilus assembly protein TadG
MSDGPTRPTYVRRTGSRRDAGSMAVELVVIAPVLALFAMLGLGLGRYELVREGVVDAARAGAQLASSAGNAGDAAASASTGAVATLAGQAVACPNPSVVTDTSAFVPGGVVRVTVTCQVPMADLGIPGFPGAMTIDVTESAPIDPYRSVQ